MYSAIIQQPKDYADSVYTLRSNSPPAQRILTYPYAKIRLREGIYYRRKRRLFNNQKRRRERDAKKSETCIHSARRERIFGGNPPRRGRGGPKYKIILEYTRKNDPKVEFLVMHSGICTCLQATGVVFRRKGSGGVHKQTHDKVLRSMVKIREFFHNSLGLMDNSN